MVIGVDTYKHQVQTIWTLRIQAAPVDQEQRLSLLHPAAINSVRIERLLRELHAGPPLRFLEDVFSLTEFASGKIAAMEAAVREAVSEQSDPQAL